MKYLPQLGKFSSLSLVAATLLMAPNLSAATWGGGNGDWVSDNWGLAGGGSPGDGAFPNEAASLTTAGTLAIGTGDNITMGANLFMNTSEVNQTGGSMTNTFRVDNRTDYTLSGGSFTGGASFRVSGGGEFNFSGGTFNASSEVQYQAGLGAVNISGGSVTIAQLLMQSTANSNASVTVIGSAITSLQSNILKLNNLGASATSNMNIVFDASGVTAWSIFGGSASLELGTGVTAADLSVNVSAMLSDGVTGVNLFDYGNAASVVGAFGTVAITDTTFGTLTLGTEGALSAGEYFLDYGGTGDTDVTLFYNTIPEPGTLALLGLGLLPFALRRRYQANS